MKLIFVYNADGGFFNVAVDMAHKIFSPATYPCSLCDLTYGIFKIRPEWADFVRQAPLPLVFLHKSEFQEAYPAWQEIPLPLVLTENEGRLETLLPAHALNELRSIADLKKVVQERFSVHLRA